MIPRLFVVFPALLLSAPCAPGFAQEPIEDRGTPTTASQIDGPPPPIPPAVMNRDESGRVTVRAIRVDEPIRVDGVLDETLYDTVPPITGLIQGLPDHGEPATEKTEVWIAFDDTNIYVGARLWDSAPESEWVANEMRRNATQLRENDTFGVLFDTFYDRRNGVSFYTNPLGAIAEFAVTNEGSPNSDWTPVWDVRTGRFDGGWTVEMEIPFKSLRYRPGTSQVWGVQFRRSIRRKNEWVHLTRIPASAARSGPGGVLRVSAAGTLVDLEAPEPSRNLEVKPYGISELRTDRTRTPEVSNALHGDVGIDLKYGLTESLTADFTYNTDFAQVEVDEEQVNLTRFDVFLPEKREFFLEGRGIFDFATTGIGGGGGRTPSLFFSRRIGLDRGQPIPILGGSRLTGKVGDFDVGALAIRTEGEEAAGARETDFTVLRLRRDIFRRSNVGMLYGNRSRSVLGAGSNQTYGLDATFSFPGDLNFVGYLARTRTPGLDGRDKSYRVQGGYAGDEWGLELQHLLVEENFDPQIGFVRRDGFRETSGVARVSPRPSSMPSIRQFTLEAGVDYIENAAEGFVETRERQGRFRVEMENSDRFTVTATESRERLTAPFEIADEVTIPTGTYGFQDVEAGYTFGPHRRYSGNLTVRTGSFFTGNRTSVGIGQGRMGITHQLSIEPSLSFNWVDLEEGSFTSHLAATRVNYSFTPRMFVSGLVQYSSSTQTFSTNLRLRWEYSPGSEIFFVYTEDRDTDVFDRFSDLSNRAFVIKVTRLFQL